MVSQTLDAWDLFCTSGRSTDRPSISLYTSLVLAVTVASALAIVLLSFSHFDVPLVLVGTIIVSSIVLRIFGVAIRVPQPRVSLVFISIATIAILLRSDIYPYLMGGQDQGLYTNMAELLLREKGLTFIDAFRSILKPEDQALYDESFISAVPPIDPTRSLYTIEFYPLHPVWMALSKWVFGHGLHTLSLLLFAALGIASGYLLAKDLFNSAVAAVLATLFLAINPALVFFSKFPVTEIVAFAFTVNGFYFFLKSLRSSSSTLRWFYWLLALLSFNGLLYTRMQFFMFLPFFGLLFLGTLFSTRPTEVTKKLVLSFISALFLLFCVSLLYFFAFQRSLFELILLYYLPLLFHSKIIIVGAITILTFVSLAGIVFYRRHRGISPRQSLDGIVDGALRFSPWLLLIALLASLPTVLSLYRDGTMPPFRFVVPTNEDPWLIRYHAIYGLALLLSPFGMLLLIGSPLIKAIWTYEARLAFLFVATVWLAILLQPWIPYYYYYARYLVSEMVPYSLILCSGILAHLYLNGKAMLARVIVVLISVYFLIFSFAQYNKLETEDTTFFDGVSRFVSPNDIILAYGLDERHYAPLRIYYGLNVFPLTTRNHEQIELTQDTLARLAHAAATKGGNLVLATTGPAATSAAMISERLVFRDQFLSNGEHHKDGDVYRPDAISRLFLPTIAKAEHQAVTLVRIRNVALNSIIHLECVKDLHLAEGSPLYFSGLIGFSGAEQNGRWSDGSHARYTCQLPPGFSGNRIAIEATAFVPDEYRQRVSISINGSTPKEFSFHSKDRARRLELPFETPSSATLTIDFLFPDAVSPKELGISGDSRNLGIQVKRILIN